MWCDCAGPMCFAKLPPGVPATPPPPPPPRMFKLERGGDCLTTKGPVVVSVPCGDTCCGAQAGGLWMSVAGTGVPGSEGDYLAIRLGGANVSFIKMDEHPDSTNTTLPQFCMRGTAYMCSAGPDITGAHCLGPRSSPIHQGFVLNTTDGTIRSTKCRSPHFKCLRVPPQHNTRAAMGMCDGSGGWKPLYVNNAHLNK
jgi:hypothetical protein